MADKIRVLLTEKEVDERINEDVYKRQCRRCVSVRSDHFLYDPW